MIGIEKFIIALLIIVLIIHILSGLFLNSFNKLVFKKGSILAWIPILNIYLFIKLTVNKKLGILISILVLSVGILSNYPSYFSIIITFITSQILLILFIYGIIKYILLKRQNRY